METSVDHQVLIIGAGPAGLTLGYYLQKSKIDYLIVDKEARAGASWAQMPEHLHLISLWPSNCLLPEDKNLYPKTFAHPAKEFSEYLENFSKKHHLNIRFKVNVQDIKKVDQIFIVKTGDIDLKAKIVIDCRGYFNFPFTPQFDIAGVPPKMLHFKDYKNTDQLSAYKKILVVGKRLSAGQVLNELAATKTHELFLSVRSPLKFSSHPMLYNFFLRNLDFIERIIKKFKMRMKNEIEVPMHYNAKKTVLEQITIKGDILKIVDKTVYFKDETHEVIDAILFTTGFKPPKVSLKNDFESSATEGLFYLGRGAQRSFTSRFIRGIREDAPVLAKLILGKIASKNSLQ